MDVTCEACGTAYYLPLEMKISENFNPNRAGDEAHAHAALDKKFQQEITKLDIVRCPSCKQLNNAMYRARTQGFKTDFWMSLIGIPLCLGVLLGIWDFKTKKNGIIPGTEDDASRSQKELLVKMVHG